MEMLFECRIKRGLTLLLESIGPAPLERLLRTWRLKHEPSSDLLAYERFYPKTLLFLEYFDFSFS